MRVALLHLINGAASVPSSILGAFSRPVPPPSTDDRRKDVRARAADAASGTARWRRKAIYTEQQLLLQQPDGYLGAHTRSLEIFQPAIRSYRGFSTSIIPRELSAPVQGFCRRGGSPHRLPAGSEEPEGGSRGAPPL